MDDIKTLAQEVLERAHYKARTFKTGFVIVNDNAWDNANAAPQLARKVLEMENEIIRLHDVIEDNEKLQMRAEIGQLRDALEWALSGLMMNDDEEVERIKGIVRAALHPDQP